MGGIMVDKIGVFSMGVMILFWIRNKFVFRFSEINNIRVLNFLFWSYVKFV